MQILYQDPPTKEQFSQIRNIYDECRAAEPLSLSCPSGDSGFILLYDNQKLVSFVSLFFPDHTICECSAYTHPDSRRQGYFTMCLEKICELLEQHESQHHCETELCFLTDGNSQDAIKALTALEAQYWYSEYRMEASVSLLLSLTLADNQITVLPEGGGHFVIRVGDEAAGSFSLYETGDSACLYELYVEPGLRRRGIANAALFFAAAYLQKQQISNLQLQVSERNHAAMALYKKTGFHVEETLSYYLY